MGKRKMDSDLHRIKLETGTVYQTSKGGNYYFRYQVKGERKCVSLKTANQEEAIRKAKALLPTVQATNLEVIATHVKVARKLAAQTKSLPISQIWETYSTHPQRALPATMREQLAYEATLAEFIGTLDRRIKQFSQITEADVIKFADYLRTTQISVSTHNRKIVRLRKIFNTLQEYRDGENPFDLKVLKRKEREEQGVTVRRLAFTREQEEQLREILDDPQVKVLNKEEIKVVFYIGMYTGQFQLAVFTLQAFTGMIHSAAFEQFCAVGQQLIPPFVVHPLSDAMFVAQFADTAGPFQPLQHD